MLTPRFTRCWFPLEKATAFARRCAHGRCHGRCGLRREPARSAVPCSRAIGFSSAAVYGRRDRV